MTEVMSDCIICYDNLPKPSQYTEPITDREEDKHIVSTRCCERDICTKCVSQIANTQDRCPLRCPQVGGSRSGWRPAVSLRRTQRVLTSSQLRAETGLYTLGGQVLQVDELRLRFMTFRQAINRANVKRYMSVVDYERGIDRRRQRQMVEQDNGHPRLRGTCGLCYSPFHTSRAMRCPLNRRHGDLSRDSPEYNPRWGDEEHKEAARFAVRMGFTATITPEGLPVETHSLQLTLALNNWEREFDGGRYSLNMSTREAEQFAEVQRERLDLLMAENDQLRVQQEGERARQLQSEAAALNTRRPAPQLNSIPAPQPDPPQPDPQPTNQRTYTEEEYEQMLEWRDEARQERDEYRAEVIRLTDLLQNIRGLTNQV